MSTIFLRLELQRSDQYLLRQIITTSPTSIWYGSIAAISINLIGRCRAYISCYKIKSGATGAQRLKRELEMATD